MKIKINSYYYVARRGNKTMLTYYWVMLVAGPKRIVLGSIAQRDSVVLGLVASRT